MKFDDILVNKTQIDTFNSVALNICNNVLNGENGTIFAYGQTGSGKTYSMIGNEKNKNPNGIIIKSIEYILNKININNKSTKIYLSICEIYNEKLKDLLEDKQKKILLKRKLKKEKMMKKYHQNTHIAKRRPSNLEDLAIKMNSNGEIYVQNLEKKDLKKNNLIKIIKQGLKNRTVAETNMNSVSSRSHVLITLNIEYINENGEKIKSKLNFVDLAGNEKVGKTNAKGVRVKEAGNINRSLSQLSLVINKLVINSNKNNKNVYVPYKDSILTRLLEDSLKGNCHASLLICGSQHKFNRRETISSLQFGKNCKKIKPKNEPRKRAYSSPLIQIKQLKKQLTQLKILHKNETTEIKLFHENIITKKDREIASLKNELMRLKLENNQLKYNNNNNSDIIDINDEKEIDINDNIIGNLRDINSIKNKRKLKKFDSNMTVHFYNDSSMDLYNSSSNSSVNSSLNNSLVSSPVIEDELENKFQSINIDDTRRKIMNDVLIDNNNETESVNIDNNNNNNDKKLDFWDTINETCGHSISYKKLLNNTEQYQIKIKKK